MKKNNKKGFTLIELLVVIAIIGILSAVVLAALGSARTKAKDTAAKAAISQLRAQAELFADGGSYDGFLADTTTLGGAALVASAESSTGTTAYVADDATSWVASIPLISLEHFCADSTGFAGEIGTTQIASAACQ